MNFRTAALSVVLLVSCTKEPTAPAATPESGSEGSAPSTSAPETSQGGQTGAGPRPGVTAAACEAQGGKVVGDIGDGAVHRSDYRCPETNQPPLGSIVAEPGGPMAVEGSVCCK